MEPQEQGQTEQESKSSQIREFRLWSLDIFRGVDAEYRPLVGTLIIAGVILVLVRSFGPAPTGPTEVIFYSICGAILGLPMIGILVLSFWNPSRAQRVAEEVRTKVANSVTLNQEERGIVALCVQVEKGRLGESDRRHISRHLKVKQGTLVNIFRRIAGEIESGKE
jgi:plasmid stabilization system protein ParE